MYSKIGMTITPVELTTPIRINSRDLRKLGRCRLTPSRSRAEFEVGLTEKPSAFVPSAFRPQRWLRGGHVQTLAAFFLPRRIDLPAAEQRLIEVEPGVPVLCHCHWQQDHSAQKRALTLIVVHGLEGSSESQYMLGIARKGLAAGMNVVRMNQRNCGGMDHCAPTLYNSSRSGDVAAVARNLVERDGISGFVLIGFSMGGNLVLKLAGEWGSDGPAEFRGVAAVCPAINLAAGADALHEPANRIYEYYFLLQLFRRFRLKVKLFPGSFDASRLRGVNTLRDFDDRVTAYYCGFTGADDYYFRAAAANVIDRIARPTLVIHAANDPFVRILPQTRQALLSNRNITYIETEDGGHCAFVGERDGDPAYEGRWAEREVVEFAKQFR
jgi:predicted alpha/beta-fold hydrolase